MYVMELESGYYLDARTKGNASRFINHSCAPNCELQKWNVKGFTRIGIMAITDISAGTPLSYDYQFATNEEGKFKCHCGAPTCRGTLAPQNQLTEDQTMEALRTGSRTDRKKLLQLCKKRERREQARQQQAAKESAARKNLTSQFLPGDSILEIRSGPPTRFLGLAKESKIFLVRNVIQGDDFVTRQELRRRRRLRRSVTEERESIICGLKRERTGHLA
ncbi:histone-lysine n [Nannochloropsis gaditana]|uniref:Histone-lysine n n=1 Tax=Nannochloropsis gaditana TaxID=72520 RepID=W7U9Q3_9STRA|nr:histone-lysine n [Nannochloropsis gaditana]